MIRDLLKRLASKLPAWMQNEMKRVHFAVQMRRGRFTTNEPEYALLDSWVTEGDCVLDVGANIGWYAAKLSQLVGSSGRVIAFEPVPETFALLAANMARLPHSNVTLVNAAASSQSSVVGISIPKLETGLHNFYMAEVVPGTSGLLCLAITVDSLQIPGEVKLVKIDVEGHQFEVLKGMRGLLERCRPVLIVEDDTREVDDYLAELGYRSRKLPGSSNRIFEAATARSVPAALESGVAGAPADSGTAT